MNEPVLPCPPVPAVPDAGGLAAELRPLDACARLRRLVDHFGPALVASTSFGLQSAVMLHLLHRHAPAVPVVFIDTGYLFPETYRYAETLIGQFGLDLRVYRPRMTAARFEALHGRQWEQGPDGIESYALHHKIEPMNRALRELGAAAWISGVRRSHSVSRSGRPFAEQQNRTIKVYPILDWSDHQVEAYLRSHELPRHPLAGAGYATMGDWHSTRPLAEAGSAEATRFNGARYECGLHLESGVQDFQI